MISTNPTEDRAIKALAATMVALMAVLTTLRACQSFRPGGALCFAVETFRAKAIAYFAERDAR
jgi:hypothetical protein